jgi:iodotyrosine deiodinase
MMQQWPFKPLEFAVLPEDEMQRRAQAFYQRAAGSAPSGANMQPWHFVAVADPALKTRIRAAAEVEERALYQHRASAEWLQALAPLGTNEHKPFLETAPWLIAVFLKKFTTDAAGRRHKHYYTAESVGIACGFLLAALHWSGLATLTHTPSPMKFLGEVLDRPDSERPFILVVTGYPAEGATVPVIGKEPLDRIATFMA